MELCENVVFLKILRVIFVLFNFLKVIVPIILIILIMVDFFKAMLNGTSDFLDKIATKSLKRFIAAVLIFFVPMIVAGIFNTINTKNTILECFTNASVGRIETLQEEEIESLISKARKTLNEDDYVKARDMLIKIKDENVKKEYEKELDEIKKEIDNK